MNVSSEQSLPSKPITKNTKLRLARPPLREINNDTKRANKQSSSTLLKSSKQQASENIDISDPTKRIQTANTQYRRQLSKSFNPPSFQSHRSCSTPQMQYSRPYSLSNFAPVSHLPRKTSNPSHLLPVSKSQPSATATNIPEHKATFLISTRQRSRAARVALPDPKLPPPDSNIAEIWSDVESHALTMTDPNTTTQSSVATDSQISDSNSQVERTLNDFKVEPEINIIPQLSTSISQEAADDVAKYLADEIKSGAQAGHYIAAFALSFCQSPMIPITDPLVSSDRLAAPSLEELALVSRYITSKTAKTSSIIFLLAADDTWKDKFPYKYSELLMKDDIFTPERESSEFLTIIGSHDASFKTVFLLLEWQGRAKKALTKQLSFRRTNANEDKCEILTNTRYYGYLITGKNLEIREMRYDLSGPPPTSRFQTSFPTVDAAESQEESTTLLKATRSLPKPKPISGSSPPLRNKHRIKPSKKPDSPAPELPFTDTLVKTLDLQKPDDIVQFSEFHHALMRWAQVKYCAQYVENLHGLIWQEAPANSANAWFMEDAEMVNYWASASPQEPVSGGAEPAKQVEEGVNSPERAGMAATKVWDAGTPGSTKN